MKQFSLLAFMLSASTAYAQPATDTMAMYIKAAVSNIIKLAKNPKKTAASLSTDLRDMTYDGQPLFAAPFSLPGYTAHFCKERTDRAAGLANWSWRANIIEAPKGTRTEEVKSLAKLADSILKTFSSHTDDAGPNKVNNIFVLENIGYGSTDNAEIRISFFKPDPQTEQQAYDSLLALYRPLLSNPATARQSSRKFCYAMKNEGFTDEKIVATVRDLLRSIAGENLEAAFATILPLPFFVPYKEVKDVFTASQMDRLKTMANKFIDDYEAEWRKKLGKADPVAVQQKQQQAKKRQSICEGERTKVEPYMLTKGITVTGFVNNTPYFGILTDINCQAQQVTITKPGTTTGTQQPVHIKVHFLEYWAWQKYGQQYYTCSRCDGAGGESITRTESKTKELPFGYFDGITTTITKTKTEKVWRHCGQCKGTGLSLENDRDPWNKKN